MSFHEVGRMDSSIRHILGLDLGPMPADAGVYETDDEYLLELEVTGFEAEDLAIQVSDHVLTVSGRHAAKADQFERRFELPSAIAEEKLSASLVNGMLKLHVPKAEQPGPRNVPIT